MELKRTNGAEQRQTGRCSNRTFMELKQLLLTMLLLENMF